MPRGVKDALKFLKKDAGGMALGGAFIMMNSEMSKTAKLWELIKLKALPISASIAGSVFGITTAIKAAIKNSGILEESFRKIDKIKFATTQFDGLYKNLERAKKEVASIIQLSSSGIFKFDDVKEGARALAILSNRALDTHTNLERIADAAAGTGTSFYDMSTAVGQAYRAMAQGDADAGLSKLQALGVLSEEAAIKIRRMGESGASLTQMWSNVESSMDSMKGKMQEVADTTEALASKYEAARSKMATAFGQHFMEEERETLKATTQVTENLIPVADQLGKTISSITGFADKWIEQFKAWITSFSIITPLVDVLARSLIALGVIITAFGAATFVASITGMAVAVWSLAGAIGTTSTTMALFAAANAMATAGNVAAATATNLLAIANDKLGGAIRASIKWIVAQSVALFASPWGLVLLAVTATIGIFTKLISIQNETNQAWDEQKQKQKEVELGITNMGNAVKDLDERQKALTASLEAQANAWKELHALEKEKEESVNVAGVFGTSVDTKIASKKAHLAKLAEEHKKIEAKTGLAGGERERATAGKRAEEETALYEQEYENRLQTADESGRRLILTRKKAELESMDVEKRTLREEEDRLSRWDLEHPTASADDRAAQRRASTSKVVKMSQAAADMTSKGEYQLGESMQVAAVERRRQIEKHDVTRSPAMQAELERLNISERRNKIDLETEEAMASIWSEGIVAAHRESDIRIASLNEQIALARELGHMEDARMLAAQRDAAILAQVRDREVAQREVDSINSITKVERLRTQAVEAAGGGRFKEAAQLGREAREEEEAQTYNERVRGLLPTMPEEEAKEQARIEQEQATKAREVRTQIFREENARETKMLELEGTKGEGKRAALQKALVLRDMESWRDTMREGIVGGLEGPELESFATNRMMAEIAKRGVQPQAVASSLAAIGGGGEVGVINPLLTVAQEQKALLDQIAKNTAKPEKKSEPMITF